MSFWLGENRDDLPSFSLIFGKVISFATKFCLNMTKGHVLFQNVSAYNLQTISIFAISLLR